MGDDGLVEMGFFSQVNVVDPIVCASSDGIQISTRMSRMMDYARITDDVVGIAPRWPNGADHGLGFNDSGFDRRIGVICR